MTHQFTMTRDEPRISVNRQPDGTIEITTDAARSTSTTNPIEFEPLPDLRHTPNRAQRRAAMKQRKAFMRRIGK